MDLPTDFGINVGISAPHPLPMPEYGGYFAPLTEFLPDAGLPITGFHRLKTKKLNVNLMFVFSGVILQSCY